MNELPAGTLHEQLLDAIEAADSHCAAEECRARDLHRKLWRAVVELHAPERLLDLETDQRHIGLAAPVCCLDDGEKWPCTTILAVASALGVETAE